MTNVEVPVKTQPDQELVRLILKQPDADNYDRDELVNRELQQLMKRGANPKITINGKTLPDICMESKMSGSNSSRGNQTIIARILLDAGAEFYDDKCRFAFMKEYVNHLQYHHRYAGSHPDFYRQAVDQLFWLVNLGHTEIFSFLLDNGADPNTELPSGQTRIFGAINNQKFQLINLLLKSGARLDIKDQSGITPLDLARSAFMKDPSDISRAKIYDMIRHETALRSPPEAEIYADKKTGELVRVTQNLFACQRITEVFNFARGVYSRTDESIDKPGIATNIRLFEELQGTGLLVEANELFKRMTGQEPPVEHRFDAKRISRDQPLPG